MPPRTTLAAISTLSLAWLTLQVPWGHSVRAESPEPEVAVPSKGESPRRTALVRMIARVRPSVVNIHSEKTVGSSSSDLTAGSNRVNGMGTGILIDPRGYIITNHHVVEDVQVLRVRLSDGGLYTARISARDPSHDLALLKIEASQPLSTIPLGTARDLMVGEDVIAIGNAYGYEHSTTRGIVSAIQRDVSLNKDMAYKSLIQTDASINPGNSGGPLLNVNGELVGVNVAIRAGAQGIGFAIPVDTVIRVAADMLHSAARTGVTHGLVIRDQVDGTDPIRRSLVVDRVEPASPAAKAGLQSGDVLLSIDEMGTAHAIDLERALLEKRPGDTLSVKYRRAQDESRVELTLSGAPTPSQSELVWQKLGVRFQPVTNDVVRRVNPQLNGGLAVQEVRPGGSGNRAGILAGDILIGLHTWETLTPDNVAFVLTHPDMNQFSPVKFFVIRSGQVRRGYLSQLD